MSVEAKTKEADRREGRGPESDGFAWPHRDGLKWLHFAMVGVLVG